MANQQDNLGSVYRCGSSCVLQLDNPHLAKVGTCKTKERRAGGAGRDAKMGKKTEARV